MSNNKQSSVQWLFEQVCNLDWRNMQGEEKLKILKQAKAMHEEECISFYVKGCEDTYGMDEGDDDTKDAKAYYSKKFGGDK